MSQADLLRVLSDGNYHSGQDLGAMLGISRAAVWKQLGKLEELGLALESVRGKGYRVAGGLDLLDLEAIRAGLKIAGVQPDVELHNVVDSTNSVAMQRALERPASGFVCVAEKQTAGRGRRGKQWQSPWGRNLYVSVLWQFNQGASALEGLSLVVGVALAEALEEAGVQDVQLKWPNDILVDGQKLAGVLLEMVGDPEGPVQVVMGFGINVRLDDEHKAAIDQPSVDVASLVKQPIGRSDLLAKCLNHVFAKLAVFERTGFAPFADAWRERDAFREARVALHMANNVTNGLGRGVNERGALLLETDAGVEAFYGGEISVRAQSI